MRWAIAWILLAGCGDDSALGNGGPCDPLKGLWNVSFMKETGSCPPIPTSLWTPYSMTDCETRYVELDDGCAVNQVCTLDGGRGTRHLYMSFPRWGNGVVGAATLQDRAVADNCDSTYRVEIMTAPNRP